MTNFSPFGSVLAWFCDPPSRGTWNMALDEALLQQAVQGGPAALRFYEWEQATLSLGYFQSFGDRDTHNSSANCAIVRRTTGGGAILHDRELTYSIVLPPGHPLGRRASDLYLAVHGSIVAALGAYGLAAQIYQCRGGNPCAAGEAGGNQHASGSIAGESFLCFLRRSAGDVLLEGRKVVGSAQRRHRGAVLQHGSVLFERSAFAPELPGICDLAGFRIDPHEFAERMRQEISLRLPVEFALSPPGSELLEAAARIEIAKFSSDDWLRMR